MSIVRAFVSYLEDSGVAILGQDLFVGSAPSSDVVVNAIWWLRAAGGGPVSKLVTGEMVKDYRMDIFYRDDPEAVYEKMFALEEQLNAIRDLELAGFSVMGIQATSFPADNDLDDEDRKVGLLQVTITTYKE